MAAGSTKVFAMCGMQAQEQRVSRRCTPAVVATPFHLGLRLLPFSFFKKKISLEKWDFYRFALKV